MYTLNKDSTISELVKKASGLESNADISVTNMAKRLEDVQYANNGFITNTTTNENNEDHQPIIKNCHYYNEVIKGINFLKDIIIR